jgi:hypothetical protein
MCLLGVLASGCAAINEERPGPYWCNEPFLPVDTVQFSPQEVAAARKGYMYVSAAAIVLQRATTEDHDHWMELPKRLDPVDATKYGKGGFEARTFKLIKEPGSPQVESIVVAFTGSNGWDDWLLTNFLTDKRQYNQAREYLKSMANRFPGQRIVVTGFSLGGGLAVHVTKHPETSALVSETWAFNPSGKTWVPGNEDKRIWLIANSQEAARYTRSDWVQWLPGVNYVGAPDEQFQNQFELYRSNAIFAHYRYVLLRNVLFAAEQDIRKQNVPGSKNEPAEILSNMRFKSCKVHSKPSSAT